MTQPSCLDKHPRIKAFLQQANEQLEYHIQEEAPRDARDPHAWQEGALLENRPQLAGGIGIPEEWIIDEREPVILDGTSGIAQVSYHVVDPGDQHSPWTIRIAQAEE